MTEEIELKAVVGEIVEVRNVRLSPPKWEYAMVVQIKAIWYGPSESPYVHYEVRTERNTEANPHGLSLVVDADKIRPLDPRSSLGIHEVRKG